MTCVEKKRDQGFSLMELLVALVILALIVGLVAPQLIGYLGRAKGQTADVQIKNLETSLSLYLVDMGGYPSASEGLEALAKSPAGSAKWRGPYIEGGKIPLDPWGEPYQYASPGSKNKGGYDLWSKGPDKQSGSADDIGNWDDAPAGGSPK